MSNWTIKASSIDPRGGNLYCPYCGADLLAIGELHEEIPDPQDGTTQAPFEIEVHCPGCKGDGVILFDEEYLSRYADPRHATA